MLMESEKVVFWLFLIERIVLCDVLDVSFCCFFLRVVKVKLIRTKKLVMIIPVKTKHLGVAAMIIAMHSREMNVKFSSV